MIILAIAPICKMGACQTIDKNLLYGMRRIPVFIEGNRILGLQGKLYYNYVSDWMNIKSTMNFLLVDSHIQFTPFAHFQQWQKWQVSWVDCKLCWLCIKDSISKNQMLLGEPMQTTSCKNSRNKKSIAHYRWHNED